MVALLVLDCPMKGATFRAHLEQLLAPTLWPDDIVIMDNLWVHTVAGIRQAIEARPAELVHLPPYSPDLNPIEHPFARPKALLPKPIGRTVSTLWTAIGALLKNSEPNECANYFRRAGYSSI